MKFHFSRGFVSKTDKPLTYQESLMLDLQKTRCELEDAYAGFDYVTDPDLIDCYIYEQNAVMKRYRYLLQQAAGLSAGELSAEEFPAAAPAGHTAAG
ncbi:MAG TPA: YaaL family protein [Candidatus Eisenbergiella merdavium]|uniref:YaaL family protein n=1 Tax=Candidatus Eisenbergiella merdavium TaxID=2838551 RepID=A0A9D2SQ73_9FIRM|nr:YaaL family protein [Candidatus Eisenbergiella merdavium]